MSITVDIDTMIEPIDPKNINRITSDQYTSILINAACKMTANAPITVDDLDDLQRSEACLVENVNGTMIRTAGVTPYGEQVAAIVPWVSNHGIHGSDCCHIGYGGILYDDANPSKTYLLWNAMVILMELDRAFLDLDYLMMWHLDFEEAPPIPGWHGASGFMDLNEALANLAQVEGLPCPHV